MRYWVQAFLFSVVLWHQHVHACTAFQLKADDGALIYARSMEFGFRMQSDMLIVPRGAQYSGTGLNNKTGLQWRTKFGFVGMNQSIAKTFVSEGMNEKGLIVGMLYFPRYAQYEPSKDVQSSHTLGSWEVGSYLLGTCSTVAEAKAALSHVIVGEVPMPELDGFVIPLHYYVADSTGAVMVVEYVDGKRRTYDNPLGVLTNSPPFDWQLINLSNYINLSPNNVPILNLPDLTVLNLGQGSGLLGLPGDFTPASRFVRAALFSQWAAKPKDAEEAVRLGFHILNAFTIFDGIVRTSSSEEDDSELPSKKLGIDLENDLTEWIVVHDRTNLKTYFRTYEGLRIEMIDLKKIDFSRGGFRKIALTNAFVLEEVTETATPLER